MARNNRLQWDSINANFSGSNQSNAIGTELLSTAGTVFNRTAEYMQQENERLSKERDLAFASAGKDLSNKALKSAFVAETDMNGNTNYRFDLDRYKNTITQEAQSKGYDRLSLTDQAKIFGAMTTDTDIQLGLQNNQYNETLDFKNDELRYKNYKENKAGISSYEDMVKYFFNETAKGRNNADIVKEMEYIISSELPYQNKEDSVKLGQLVTEFAPNVDSFIQNYTKEKGTMPSDKQLLEYIETNTGVKLSDTLQGSKILKKDKKAETYYKTKESISSPDFMSNMYNNINSKEINSDVIADKNFVSLSKALAYMLLDKNNEISNEDLLKKVKQITSNLTQTKIDEDSNQSTRTTKNVDEIVTSLLTKDFTNKSLNSLNLNDGDYEQLGNYLEQITGNTNSNGTLNLNNDKNLDMPVSMQRQQEIINTKEYNQALNINELNKNELNKQSNKYGINNRYDYYDKLEKDTGILNNNTKNKESVINKIKNSIFYKELSSAKQAQISYSFTVPDQSYNLILLYDLIYSKKGKDFKNKLSKDGTKYNTVESKKQLQQDVEDLFNTYKMLSKEYSLYKQYKNDYSKNLNINR